MLSERTNGALAADVGVEALASELDAVAEALRAAGGVLATSASRVLPAADRGDSSICSRYQRAAASWPTTPPPSHERFAGAVARIHDAADATRLAGRRCDEARRSVEALLRQPPSAPSR
jgi:hypothetical protein